MQTVHQLLEDSAAAFGDRDLLVFPERRIKYSELRREAERAAAGLAAAGVGPGDRVGVLLPNYLEMAALFFATSRLGAVWVPFSIRYRPDELAYVLAHSEVKVLITTDRISDYVDLVGNVRGQVGAWDADGLRSQRGRFPSLERIICVTDSGREDVLTYRRFLALAEGKPLPASQGKPSDLFSILYTSGTTGEPKGVMLNHHVFVQRMSSIAERLLLQGGEGIYGPLPWYHMAGYIPLMCALMAGGAWVGMTHFDAETAAALIERERCTVGWPAFDNVISPLLEEPLASRYDLTSLKVASVIGPRALLLRLSERLPNCAFIQPYGSTEMGGAISLTLPTDDLEIRIGTVGKPFDAIEVKMVDESGKGVPSGSVGEICVRGPAVCLGYYGDPDRVMEAFDDEGWFHGGDLGFVNERGEIVYSGRLKEMIKVGGENIAPVEVENFLLSNPKVKAAVVVGVPDQRYMEVPAAFVETEPQATCDEAELRDYCSSGLARFKVPRYFRFVSEWPMSATKVHKPTLRKKLMEELGIKE